MITFRTGMALAILIVLLAGCGGDSGSDSGAGLVAQPTRTPAPGTDIPAENADSAGDTAAPQAHLTATQFGLGAASALSWIDEGQRLLVSGLDTGWAYNAAPLDAAPTALDTAWSGPGRWFSAGRPWESSVKTRPSRRGSSSSKRTPRLFATRPTGFFTASVSTVAPTAGSGA